MINTLITGSSKGIGYQIGIDLLKQGHNVIFTSRTSSPNPFLTNYHIIDFSNLRNIEAFARYIHKHYVHIDNLILNVGTTCRKNLTDISMFEWNQIFDTNLNYPFYFIKLLQPIITRRIIFIGSTLGNTPDASSIAYGVSKGSLPILTKYLAKEFAPNITVNTIAPGFINTNWHINKSMKQKEQIKKKILCKRFGTTKEISNACQFIINNDYITGQTIYVDGGYGLV